MTTIQILGIEGSPQTIQLRNNLLEALVSLSMRATVENVSGMDQLMKYRINGIPALVVDGTVVLQKIVPPAEDLKIMLNAFVEGAFKQFAMKNILVPTDFSPAAKGAFQFALDLAELQNGRVKAVHVYHPEFDPESNWLDDSFLDGVGFANEKLAAFVQEESSHTPAGNVAVEVEQEVITGFAVDEILALSKRKDVEMIVMGSTGEKGFLEKLFGSVSTNVTQRAECPVMLVPQGVQFQGFKHIMYASNYEAAEQPTLHKLVDVANAFHADIHFVHVAEEGDSQKTYQEIESRLFKVLFNGNDPSFAFNLTNIEGHSVVEGLNDYALKHQIDLVVMVCPHRRFWETLFHKSVTKAMVLNTKLPILVLHG